MRSEWLTPVTIIMKLKVLPHDNANGKIKIFVKNCNLKNNAFGVQSILKKY